MIIQTTEPNKHRVTLANGARLDIAEGEEGRISISNCSIYTQTMAVAGMSNWELHILVRPKEAKAAEAK